MPNCIGNKVKATVIVGVGRTPDECWARAEYLT